MVEQLKGHWNPVDYLGMPMIITQLILKQSRGSGIDDVLQRLQVWPTTTIEPSGISPW